TLGRLDIIEFIAETPKKEDLDKVYGLDKPAVTATLTLADAKKALRVLRIGKESTDKKDQYFARVDEGPVFLIRKNTLETVQKDALASRTLPLWDVPAERIREVQVKKGEGGFTLKRDGSAWKITEPFAAPAVDNQVRTMVAELSDPRREKYVAHQADDPKNYGLDQPALRLTLLTDDKEAKSKSYTLEIGKPVEKDGKARYARLEGDKAVFTIGDKLVQSVDRTALDLLDRTLVKLDPKSIQQVR